jgi:hypothetical protein
MYSIFCVDEMCVAACIGKITFNATGLNDIPLAFTKLLLPFYLCLLNCLTLSLLPLHSPLSGRFRMSSQFRKLIPLRKNLTIAIFPSFLSSQRLLRTLCLSRWLITLHGFQPQIIRTQIWSPTILNRSR